MAPSYSRRSSLMALCASAFAVSSAANIAIAGPATTVRLTADSLAGGIDARIIRASTSRPTTDPDILAALAQPLEHLPQTLDLVAVFVGEPRLHQSPQRGVEVAVVDEVVGDLAEHVLGRELEADLGAVPPRVGESVPGTRRPVLPPAAHPTTRHPGTGYRHGYRLGP